MLVILLILIVSFWFITLYKYKDVNYIPDLKENGFMLVKNAFTDNDIKNIKSSELKQVKNAIINSDKIKNIIKHNIGVDFVLQDYIWYIKRSQVHTCHRDNNGDFFNANQKHPSYTMIIYLEDMEKCLGVVNKSHTRKYSIFDKVENILCNKGDLIIFNANLIHTGVFNRLENNPRIQMKITHKDDIKNISYYENFNKIVDTPSKTPVFIRKTQQKLSCITPIISDLTQKININSARGSDNGSKVGLLQKMFSFLFYGDSNFYDLPNAF